METVVPGLEATSSWVRLGRRQGIWESMDLCNPGAPGIFAMASRLQEKRKTMIRPFLIFFQPLKLQGKVVR